MLIDPSRVLPITIITNMAVVNIEIKSVADREDLQRWEDSMLVNANVGISSEMAFIVKTRFVQYMS